MNFIGTVCTVCGLNVPHNGQPNMTITTVFSLLKLSDHVICIETYGNSFPTPRTTILRPIFYCCNTFDRV